MRYDRINNRLKLEKMTESVYTRYQYEHSYDSAGNRTSLVVSGTYHPARNFGYTYNGMGHMLTVTENTNLSNYVATVSTDANGNITEIEEVRDVSGTPTTVSTNTFEYDRENRLIEQVVDSNQSVTVAHAYDGLGRLVRTSRTVSGPTTTEYRHVRNGLQIQGNIDYTNSQTAPTWTNTLMGLMPIESQQIQTNSSQQYINISDEITPARLTYHPTTSAAGDTSTVAAKGSYSVINGSAPAVNSTTLHSELFYHRNVTINQNTIALPSNKGVLEIAGTNLLHEGLRVKSYVIGRDLNPMGRGYGIHYAHGMFSAGNMRPIASVTPIVGFGNSVNNGSGFKFFERNPDCWIEPGECGWVMGGWVCSIFKCYYTPEDYGGGGQVPCRGCPCDVATILCQVSLLASREGIRTGKSCFRPNGITCVESPDGRLYSQSAMVTTLSNYENCKEYSIDHIMYLYAHMGGTGPCVERDPCASPVVLPMPPPAGSGGGCPGCGATGGGGSGVGGSRYGPGLPNQTPLPPFGTPFPPQHAQCGQDFASGMSNLQQGINDPQCRAACCCGPWGTRTTSWGRTHSCNPCDNRYLNEALGLTTNRIHYANASTDRNCWVGGSPGYGVPRTVYTVCGPPNIHVCCGNGWPTGSIYGWGFSTTSDCEAAAIMLFEVTKCANWSDHNSTIQCAHDIIYAAICLCECAKNGPSGISITPGGVSNKGGSGGGDDE